MAEHLTRNQIQDVLDFAQALYVTEQYGAFSPYMSNQLLQNLNNNPKLPTTDTIKKALSNYKKSAKDLQSFTEFMSNYDMIFKRTLFSYVNALAFDLQIVPQQGLTKEDYESEEYKEDKKRINNFVKKFDYKGEFRKVTVQLMKSEVYYTWFRKTKVGNKGMKFALQIMPQQYCMTTGYWEKGILYDLDYNYFLQPSVDIDGFDPSIAKTYNRIFSSTEMINYRPTAQLNERTGQYAYWAQTSPADGAWCFKFDPSNFNNTPFLAPFLKDTIRNDEIGVLQYNKDMISAYAILAGEIRLFDNAKSGTNADQFAINPKTLGAFMGKAKAGLGSLVKLAALPVENSKMYQFTDSNTNMYSDQLTNSAGVGSGVSRVIYSSDRMSNAEIEAGLTEQYTTMAMALYPQFQNFMEYYGNKLTKKYKFSFVFTGSNYQFERDKRMERLVKIADHGLVLGPSAWASALGYNPVDFEALLEEGAYSNFSDKFRLMLNTNTSKDGSSSNNNGRPKLDNKDLSDSGEQNRNE